MRKSQLCSLSKLQAFVDNQLSEHEREQVATHLVTCEDCRTKYEHLNSLTKFMENHFVKEEIPRLAFKLPAANESILVKDADLELNWKRLKDRLKTVNPSSVWENPSAEQSNKILEMSNETAGDQFVSLKPAATGFSVPTPDPSTAVRKGVRIKKMPRFAAIAVVVLAGTGMFATGLGNQALAAMLQTFRVQHLVGVNEEDFTKITQQLRADGGTIDLKQYGQITETGKMNQQLVSSAEAAKLIGRPIELLPGMNPEKDKVSYLSGTDIVFQLHVGPINALLHRLGGKTDFPVSLEGKSFVFHVPPVVSYSQSVKSTGTNQPPFYNVQILKAPSLDVPEGVDIEQVRRALLDLPFLPDTVRSQLLRTEDWKNTLFIPTGHGKTQDITLNGHEAVLSTGPASSNLMWLQDGYIYTLNLWNSPGQSVPSPETLIRLAKEIAK